MLAGISYIAAAAVFGYGAYWAFMLKRVLAGRIYRNHALWLGVLCVVLAFTVGGSLLSLSNNALISIFASVPGYAAFLVTFAFVDSTVPVARRSDPLLRRILDWEKVRLVIWPVLFLLIFISLYPAFYLYSTYLLIALFVLVPVPGGLALLIGGRRSRNPVLRESLKWFGIALFFVLGFALVAAVETALAVSDYNSTYSYGAVPWNAVFLLVGYALYRSTRSLVPVNHLPPELIPAANAASI